MIRKHGGIIMSCYLEKSTEYVDVFDIINESTQTEGTITDTKPIDEALFDCLNRYGEVDIEYICGVSGLITEKVIESLKGTIFQNPEPFLNGEPYSLTSNWLLSSRYLSGNVRNKLSIAQKANKKYFGAFDVNIEKLSEILPQKVDIDDIHLSLGAPYIPVEEYARFIADFLKLKETPEVSFYKDLLTYKIVTTDESRKSVLNTITYGVREDYTSYGMEYSKQYLTAIDIIEQTMNAKTIKVYDYIPKGGGWNNYEYEAVLNQSKTVEAQDKQRAIIDAFKDYVYGDRARTVRFEQYYNDKLVGYTYSRYDGGFLKLSDLNPEVSLYKHQRDAVARILLSGSNLLLAHDVGTGKTYEMIVSVHELYRMGVSRKNLIVVPNNVLKATEDAHRYLYKDDNILVVYPKDFTPNNRNAILAKIRDNDYVAIYMAYSSFDMVVMSKNYYINKYSAEIKDLTTAYYNINVKHEKKAIKRKRDALKKKLEKYVREERECEWLTFDKLGITTLVVDEAHNYKNIPIQTRADSVVGMSGSSKKCREMLEKAHFVDRLIFATGTPLTNSLADLFTFQTYLQPATLEYHKINTFDTWVNTFGQRETTIECDVDANSKKMRTMTRFSSFHNLSELMGLFSQVCDFHNLNENEGGLPVFNGYTDVCVPKNEAQRKYIADLSERTDNIRSKQVKRNEDNLLKITTDGRKAALDIRLVDSEYQYNIADISKIDVCADNVFHMYKKYPDSVQIVFSDIGTPKAKFNVYDALASKLVKLGMLRTEIAFVHDATTEAARTKLFNTMNKGQVRVVVGSTQKLGVGVNVQEKLVALHHLSVPWRPADMVQREGRILRKGNTSNEVFIYRYITEGSFDAYSWQLLENKQRFISSFLSGTSASRDMDDIADAVLTYAEVKALAIGNPLIKRRVEVANRLERIKIVSRSRQKEIQHLQYVVRTMPQEIKRYNELYEIVKADYNFYIKTRGTIANDERNAFGEELIEALKSNAGVAQDRLFDEYQGFDIILPAEMEEEKSYVIIKRKSGGIYRCAMDLENKTPLGVTKSIDAALEHISVVMNNYLNNKNISQKRLDEAKEDIEKGNPHFAEIDRIKQELAEIDTELESVMDEKKSV